MNILALDIATQTGVAFGCSGADPECWSEDLGKGMSEDARFSKALSLTHNLIIKFDPDQIAVEAAIGGKNTSHFLVGLLACVRGCAFNRKVPLVVYHASSIRKHFVGKALTTRDFPGVSTAASKRAIKETVMKRCKMLGWTVPDDDAADAAALWDYAQAKMREHQSKPVGGLFGR